MSSSGSAGTSRASPAGSRASLLTRSIPALQLPPEGRAGADLGPAGGDGSGQHGHLILVIADTAGTAIGQRAAQGTAGGLRAGTLRLTGDVPGGLAAAQCAGKVDVEGVTGGDQAGEALQLAVAVQVRWAGAGQGTRGTAATSSGGGCALQVPLGAWGAAAGVTAGFWGRAVEQEAGEPRLEKGAGESHGSGGKKGK